MAEPKTCSICGAGGWMVARCPDGKDRCVKCAAKYECGVKMELTHFSLFSGIGGFDLAAEWAGFRTIGLVEKNPYRQKVLRKYWPNVPLWEEIRDVTEKSLKEKGIIAFLDDTAGTGHMEQPWEAKTEQSGDRKKDGLPVKAGQDVADSQLDGRAKSGKGGRPRGLEEKKGEEGKTGNKPPQAPQYSSQNATRGTGARTDSSVTLVTGGFPCQGFSVAGKRRGTADDRYLWPEMLRVIKIIRPRWVLAENVAGIVRMALDTVLSDLEGEGYSTQAFNIPACAVNAPHRRERIWIVAHYEGSRLRPQFNKFTDKLLPENRSSQKPESNSGDVADTTGEGLQNWGRSQVGECGGEKPQPDGCGSQLRELQNDTKINADEGWWTVEPDMGRVAYGVPHRVDRLSALGDAIVPQVAYRILRAIAEIERR